MAAQARARRWRGIGAATLVAAAVGAPLAFATPIGGGTVLSGGGATWDPAPDESAYCVSDSTPTGFTPVYDGSTANRNDAFDGGLMLIGPGDEVFGTGATEGTLNGKTFSVGPRAFAGLKVTSVETALTSSPTLREIYRLKNSTSHRVGETLRLESNLGSDETSQIDATSTGKDKLTPDTRWLVTSEANPLQDTSDPPVTQALYGRHAAVPVKQVYEEPGVACAHGAYSDAVVVGYHVTVPAHKTRYLMFFAQLTDTSVPDAINLAKTSFQKPKQLPNSLLKGVDPKIESKILNWAL